MKKISIALLAIMLVFSAGAYAQSKDKPEKPEKEQRDRKYKKAPKKDRPAAEAPMTKPEVDRTTRDEENKEKSKTDSVHKKP